jgi:hypothetical protein
MDHSPFQLRDFFPNALYQRITEICIGVPRLSQNEHPNEQDQRTGSKRTGES